MDTFTIANQLFLEQQQRDPVGFEAFLEQVAQRSEELGSSYLDASQPAAERYNSLETAYAYLYKYTPMRSSVIRMALHNSWIGHLNAVCASGQTPSVLVAGGGPGTEIIALGKLLQLICRGLEAYEYPAISKGCTIKVTVYDSVQHWTPILENVARLVNASLQPIHFSLALSTVLADLSSCQLQGPFSPAHNLLIVSYAFAEITGSRMGTCGSDNLVSLVKCLKPGAGVLLLESAQDGRGSELDQFANLLKTEGLTDAGWSDNERPVSQEHMDEFSFWKAIERKGGHSSDYTTKWRLVYLTRSGKF